MCHLLPVSLIVHIMPPPPSSLHYNRLDYYMWGVLEKGVKSRRYNTKEAFKADSRYAMANVVRDLVANACSSFRSYLQKMVAIDVDFCTLYMCIKVYTFSLKYINLLYKKCCIVLSINFSGFICVKLVYNGLRII